MFFIFFPIGQQYIVQTIPLGHIIESSSVLYIYPMCMWPTTITTRLGGWQYVCIYVHFITRIRQVLLVKVRICSGVAVTTIIIYACDQFGYYVLATKQKGHPSNI